MRPKAAGSLHAVVIASMNAGHCWLLAVVSTILDRCPHQLTGHELTISVVDGLTNKDGIVSMDEVIGSSSSEAVSCAIELRDFTPDITEEILRMFFQNRKRSGGDEIEEMFYGSEERRAVITFAHPEGCISPSCCFGI